ncbi:hypothetical protein FF1_035296 [Malus domestica]
MIQRSNGSGRRVLTYPAVHPCEAISPLHGESVQGLESGREHGSRCPASRVSWRLRWGQGARGMDGQASTKGGVRSRPG